MAELKAVYDPIGTHHALPGDMKQYEEMYAESIDPATRDEFWRKQSSEFIDWIRPYDTVTTGGFAVGDQAWFVGGQLNVSACCLDRHLATKADKTCIVWEADEPGQSKKLSYLEVFHGTCRVANALKLHGARKGDFVTIYMPMMPDTALAMLACTRIGCPHSVVFAGFTATSLKDRILDSQSKWVCTADVGKRGSKTIKLKEITDAAVSDCPNVQNVFVFKRTGESGVPYNQRDVHMDVVMPRMRPYCHAEAMGSEETMFTLYTSGSTGKPKGVAHSYAGYLLFAAMTTKYSFDLRDDDVFACVADVGWITGHSYIVYGPLCNGATTVMFESVPTYPDPGRYWDMVQRHRITSFYTAPTAIRALMKFGTEHVKKYDKSSLRVLGSVGEPINPEAWRWYFEEVGEKRCVVVDTFWQTETGGHMITNLPGCTPMKPGAASLPMFGVRPVVVDPTSGEVLQGNGVEGVLCVAQPWPGIARTIYGDHARYLETYLKPYGGKYFTGDGCKRDADGYYWITGRVDDVLNVSGHRLGTAEIESALVLHPACVEAAVVGVPHDVKGQGVFAYVILAEGVEETADLIPSLKMSVRKEIGGLAIPDGIVVVSGLPKTRSGKIMRRVLRKVACNEADTLGDTSTLADPSIVEELVAKVAALQQK